MKKTSSIHPPLAAPSLPSLRRTIAEFLASVVQELFPDVLLKGGGDSQLGFYYDFSFTQPLPQEMLLLLEQRLKTKLKLKEPWKQLEMMRENCVALLLHYNQPLLAEKVAERSENIVSLIHMGSFYGFPEAPLLQLDELTYSVKLLEMSHDSSDPSGREVRILGTAFFEREDLKNFIKQYDQLLKKKDHRRLGEEIELFKFYEKTGTAIWYPKGVQLKNFLLLWMESLWKGSRHLRVSSSPFDASQPSSIGAQKKRAMRNLFQHPPFRHYEDAIWLSERECFVQPQKEVERWGLFCTHSYEADWVGLFCSTERILQELISCLQIIESWVTILGFEAYWQYARPLSPNKKEVKAGKGAGDKSDLWLLQQISTLPLQLPLKEKKREDGVGDAVKIRHLSDGLEHEPSLELRFLDSLGREWPGPFVAIDLVEGAVLGGLLWGSFFGSMDRVVALLVEKNAGYLPFWLAPEQIRVISIGSEALSYAQEVSLYCKKEALRVETDYRSLSLSEKVLAAERAKIPCLLIVGVREQERNLVVVRRKGRQVSMPLKKFLTEIQTEIKPAG